MYDIIVACEIDPPILLKKISSKESSNEENNGVGLKVTKFVIVFSTFSIIPTRMYSVIHINCFQ